ncbi:MAG TPA: HEAT repeat domain-containing protein [Chloroflexota bacterium]|nr:HEAT repeat domain-containing protein [Chloroflexota bacterium]
MDPEIAALTDLLRTSKRGPMRLEAARQLALRRSLEAAAPLLAALEESNDPRIVPVVTVALEGLETIGPDLAPLLLPILEDSADPRRVFVPLLLRAALGEAAVPRLVEALSDRQPAVAINAATQLGQLRSPESFAPLLALAQDESQPSAVRGVAAASLGNLRDSRALPFLAGLVDTDDPELLAGAIDGLADLRDPAGIPYLEAVLERPNLDPRINRAVRLGLLAMERYRER